MHKGDTDAFNFRPGQLDAVVPPGGVRRPIGLSLDWQLWSAELSSVEGRSPDARVDAARSVRATMTEAYQVLGAMVAFVVVTFPLLVIGYLLFG